MTASAQKTSPLLIRGFGLSHVGAHRKRNEDAIYIATDGNFAILADGMGGHLGGQEASGMAIRLMRAQIEEYLELAQSDRQAPEEFLRSAFAETSAQINAEGKRNPALANMGATLICLLVLDDSIYVAHSGDSRGYFIRNSQIFQVTPDHTLENEQILAGRPRSEVELMTIKHVLSRNVGMFPVAPPDVVKFPVLSGDIWMLCSDGLSNKLKPSEILWHFVQGRGNLPKTAKGLIEHAFHAGGEDNISVCLIGIDTIDKKPANAQNLGLSTKTKKTPSLAALKQK
jgi:serine/threonine protein phosphatase PrpC